jgi:hypothetical protein
MYFICKTYPIIPETPNITRQTVKYFDTSVSGSLFQTSEICSRYVKLIFVSGMQSFANDIII